MPISAIDTAGVEQDSAWILRRVDQAKPRRLRCWRQFSGRREWSISFSVVRQRG